MKMIGCSKKLSPISHLTLPVSLVKPAYSFRTMLIGHGVVLEIENLDAALFLLHVVTGHLTGFALVKTSK